MLSPIEILDRLACIRERRAPVAFDVEGQQWMTCCGFATGPHDAFVVDTLGLKGQPHAGAIWEAIRTVLEDPRVRKVCWNAGHERGFLQAAHGIRMVAFEDAMLLWAERWPELPKKLKYAASILTRIPCWTEGISWREDSEVPHAAGPLLWRYNAHDCLATLQLYQHPQLQLTGRQLDRYHFNLSLIEPLNYASQRGVLYDTERAEQLRAQLAPQAWEAQSEVDRLAGIEPLATPEAILEAASAALCNKVQLRKRLHGYKQRVSVLAEDGTPVLKRGKPAHRNEPIAPRALSWTLCLEVPNKDCSGPLRRIKELSENPTPAAHAEINALLDRGLNVKSSGESSQVVACLNRLGLPPVFKRGTRKVAPDNPDAEAAPSQSKDQEALLGLFLKTGHPITTAILRVMALRGRLQELDRGVSSDGRIRCSFTVLGTETARITSHKWLDGSGGNLQTVPKEPVNFRTLYRADPGHLWWRVDLTGADLWTVACRVASLGDRTMLEDLLAGIRIPSLVGLLMEGYATKGLDRAAIKADCITYRARIKASGEGWKDTLWKKASHLTNYGGKPARIRQGVIEDSYSETGTPVDPGKALCEQVQRLYLTRYWGLPRWWSDVSGKILRTGCLEMANGQIREFLSRRPRNGRLDDETRREALAAEPQTMTTYAANLATDKLWNDPENWPGGTVSNGDPTIQVLLFVHDELSGQCPVEQRPFLAAKTHAAFDNELVIGRERIRIPFAGSTGPSWGECKEPL